MALRPQEERLEHRLRVEQMQTNIEKMRRDLIRNEQEWREGASARNKAFWLDVIKILIAMLAAVAGVSVASITIYNHFNPRPPATPAAVSAPAMPSR